MAEESQYSSGTPPATVKRKYQQQTMPSSTPRPTAFSAPLSPEVDDIQLAKLKAQEIAARLFNSASAGALDAKRPRTENGGGGFDSTDKGLSSSPNVKLPFSNSASSAIPVSYGYHSTSKIINIPNGRVGVIIGKAGETIKYLQIQSGAKIQVTRDADADPNSSTRTVELMGNPEQIDKAEQLISEVLAEADSGGSGSGSRRVNGQSGTEQYVTKIPNNKVGLVIGKGGETIKNMQARTGARIQVIPLHLPPGDSSTERTLQIDGTSEQIESAKLLVDEVISENHARNPAMAGGYLQQGYQARPPTSWSAVGAPPMQQSGYGYVQPGAYPGPPQCNMTQPPYAGYPSQPTSGGYPSNWEQSSTVPPTQQPNLVSGYDYYSQQQTPGGTEAPVAENTSGYNYNQLAASSYNQQGHGYSQYGNGGGYPQSGYGQPPSYDQQQSYDAATGYGNVANTTQEEHTSVYATQTESTQAPPSAQSIATGQQGYNSGQQSSPTARYPSQGTTQAGYGFPPTSESGYGNQPSAQSGYPN